MIRTHLLGHPRIGAQRELKFALERHWRGDIDAAALEDVGRTLRRRHWAGQRDRGLDVVAVGDFSLYDHVADHIALFGCEPARFGFTGRETALARYFTMARGVASEATAASACGHDHGGHGGSAALDMTKWFDTNYHHLVPEFAPTTSFTLHAESLLAQVQDAQQQGHTPKPVLLGPLTFLWLGKSTTPGFDRLDLLEELLPAYRALLDRLAAAGVTWVQIDEPILGLDLPGRWAIAYQRAYQALASANVSLLLATYFSSLAPHISMACQLPVAGLHIDLVRAPGDLPAVLDWLPPDKVLSVGVVDGRNIWRTDLAATVSLLRDVAERRRGDVWIAPSCSLLHVPTRLADDASLDPEVRGWLAGAQEKLDELATLKDALTGGDKPSEAVQRAIAASSRALAERAASPRVRDAAVAARLAALPEHSDRRASPFPERQPLQRARLRLPAFPTTTIGSFPQTGDIRGARAAFKRGALDAASYRSAMQREIAHAVRQQEAIGLDVLVHGEAERNDMVEYFGEQLDGFAFTANGWVQSYGSRCVKPPVLYGDVARPQAMTVDWATYAQSLTDRPMKGMLTGPITILQWSFVRDDQPRSTTALQIALAIRDEVVDLEAAGIGIVQIDEPALREGLPLHAADHPDYLRWATHAFRVAASGVADATQIHTHMCYAEFNDILPAIAALDADVITIETSRSDAQVLRGLGTFRYPNEIGPGVYDIHSPNVPTVDAMRRLLLQAAEVLPPGNLWVNPDCGLKTRGWPETEAALRNMVQAARELRRASPVHEATSLATQST